MSGKARLGNSCAVRVNVTVNVDAAFKIKHMSTTNDPRSAAIAPADKDPRLLEQAEKLRESGQLGRAGHLTRVFDYLVDCSLTERAPKELEIATAALGRDAGFDSSQDAAVRVYMHKLRRKLDEFYAGPGRHEVLRLSLPKGDYRLALVAANPAEPMPEEPADAAEPRAEPLVVSARRRWMGAALAASLGVNALLGGILALRSRERADNELLQLRESRLWAPLLVGDRPVVIVVGDYFLLGETDGSVLVKRLVREFDINSRDDLARRQTQRRPGEADNYLDLDLAYLPTSVASGLREIVPILAVPAKRLRVVAMSQLSTDILGIAHVVYLGLFSGLGKLQSLVFAGSGFAIGETYDELIDAATKKRYASGAGVPRASEPKVHDYGYVSSFAGPSGNRFVVLAGMRDIGLLQATSLVGRLSKLQALEQAGGGAAAFEALYEAHGLSQTLLETTPVLVRPLDAKRIWRNP